MKRRFGIVFALLAVLVGANVGGVGQAKAQFGGSPLPGFPPGVFQNRAALDAPAAPFTPAIDGTASCTTGSSPCTFSLTTTKSNDLIVIACTNNGSSPLTANTVTVGGSAATYRTNPTVSPSNPLAGGNTIYEYYYLASAPLAAASIVATLTTSTYLECLAWGVSGVNFSTPFDTNASVPDGVGSGTMTLSTSNANDLIWMVGRSDSGLSSSNTPSGWTTLAYGAFSGAFYQTFTSTQSGLTVPDFNGAANNGAIADAAQN
jgi:hypothetical protein